jgi:hypothetical protein
MRLLRRLAVPATESQLGIALAVSMVLIAGLLCALLWQSNVIAGQRDQIRWLWDMRFGG